MLPAASAAGSGLAVLLLCGSALAQTASQVTPPTFQPPLQRGGGGFDLPETSGPTAPSGAEKLNVKLSRVVIEGGLPALATDEARISESLSGRTVTAADLFAAAGELERAYAVAGYGLVRVILPAQRLKDGAVLRIVVIDGFLERIDTSSLSPTIRDRVARVLAPLAGQKGLTNTVIERQLLLAGDTPGTALRSTLSKGSKAGASVLTIEARYRPLSGSLTLDNTLSRQLGRYNAGLGVEFNSLLGLGEIFYLRASGAPRFDREHGFSSDRPRNRSLAGGVTFPLGIDGLTLNLEATASRTLPEAGIGGLALMSDFKRYSARLAYPLIRSRDLTLNLTGAFDAQNEDLSIANLGGFPISKDRLRILRAGTDFSWYVAGDALLTAGVTASFGIDGLGARDAAQAKASNTPLSRQGADAEFQKIEVSAGYRQPVAEHLTLDFRAKAQTSFGQPLLNSEQIGLASLGGLSTFPSGTMQGDDGFVLRAEAQFPFVTSLPSVANTAVIISPYLFGAYGGVRLHQPTVLEVAWAQGAAYGLGLRFGAALPSSASAMNLNLEYGRTERFGDGDNKNRFTLSAAFQF